MALPGIGKLTAMTLVAEIGDIARFPTAGKLCAWAGLTRKVRNLRPQDPPWPHHQAGLPVGAWDPAGGRPDRQAPPHVRQRLRQLAHRRGNNIATVAIARRLLARWFHILKQLEAQQNPPEKARTGRARVSACASQHRRLC
jgi:transposase